MDETPEPTVIPADTGPGEWARGWIRAGAGALVTAAGVFLFALAVVFAFEALGGSSITASITFRVGLALFFVFHHVGFTLDLTRLTFASGAAGSVIPNGISVTVALAALTGTLAAGLGLGLAGRSVGRSVDGPGWVRGLHGAKVGLPYGVIALAASYATGFSTAVPSNPALSGTLSLHASHPAAFLWPFGLGVAFGFLGGFWSRPNEQDETPALRRLRGALAGGWRMAAAGLALSYLGLLLHSAARPRLAGLAYNVPTSGAKDFLGGLLLTILTVPNRAALVLFPSMGSCVGASVSGAGANVGFCLLSYQHFPSRAVLGALGGVTSGSLPAGGGPSLARAPLGYLGFLLVPAVATVFGGLIAARRSRPQSRTDAMTTGAAAGIVYAALAVGLAVLATISVRVAGSGASERLSSVSARGAFGPEVATSALLALVWGVVGGAIGAVIGWRGRAVATAGPVVEPSTYGFGSPEPTPPGEAPSEGG